MSEDIERVYVRAWRDRRTGIVLDTLNDDSEIVPTFVVLRSEDILDEPPQTEVVRLRADLAAAQRVTADRIKVAIRQRIGELEGTASTAYLQGMEHAANIAALSAGGTDPTGDKP